MQELGAEKVITWTNCEVDAYTHEKGRTSPVKDYHT